MNAKHPSRRHDRAGVTLIETIAVITLLVAAVVASSVMFNGRWVARRGVTSATNDVADSLIVARNTAITNQAIVRVRRMRSDGRQQLLISEDAGPLCDPASNGSSTLIGMPTFPGRPGRFSFRRQGPPIAAWSGRSAGRGPAGK